MSSNALRIFEGQRRSGVADGNGLVTVASSVILPHWRCCCCLGAETNFIVDRTTSSAATYWIWMSFFFVIHWTDSSACAVFGWVPQFVISVTIGYRRGWHIRWQTLPAPYTSQCLSRFMYECAVGAKRTQFEIRLGFQSGASGSSNGNEVMVTSMEGFCCVEICIGS